ncbi:hypothetical protein LTR36_001170 [Oleoguttula mirabilis]|uniref:Uncharacterized protein n=1 Tax=Oleoguttula mirabilis TaxID=1507867 RepID=A0AAV9J3G6_9PEZI|nr:hypothetical protein LTR36_001170 [Oleoguttula mirabilis]
MFFPTTLLTLALSATTALAATKFTTTTTAYAVQTGATSDCGAFSTVPTHYAHCSAGCRPLQLPGALGPPVADSPWHCSDPPVMTTKETVKTKTVTCGAGSTVREMTPAYGAKWAKCTN